MNSLRAGDALTTWQVGQVSEVEDTTPDSPMQGEMDSLFFLTKDKNVIPHTYPCRTAYRAERAGKRPEPREEAMPDWESADVRAYLPFGAPLLDLSGFWFRATHLSGWVRTVIEAERPGEARFRLGTCGGALCRVNGVEAGWLAPATRNAMDHCTFSAPLKAGRNEILIWFEDLAERDARIMISLEWLDGPVARAASPFAADPQVVRAIETCLSHAHFSRLSYDNAPIALRLPEPLPFACTASVVVAGDFMSHSDERLALELPAGAQEIPLVASADVRPDYRHFTLTLCAQGFEASRTLGVEISRRQRQGAAPLELAERIEEALDWVSHESEPDTVRALARLAQGLNGEETDAMIAQVLPTIEACWDCADFALVPLLWARKCYGEAIGEATRSRIDAAILGYRYWMDEPGNDVQWYFSENHALLFHTAAYLAGDMLPHAHFRRSGRNGAEQSAVGRERVRAWLDHFETAEMAEFNSAPYFPIDLKGLCALFALAPDADIRQRAGRGIVRLLLIVAHSAHQGVITAAQGRSYEHTLCAGETLELSAVARLLWGQGSMGARVHCLPQLALCLREFGLAVPEELRERAIWSDENRAQEWCFAQGERGFARLYHYKTAHTAMGSAARYRWNEWGYQETLLHARIGRTTPQAQIWLNMPGELVQSGYGRPSYWGGSAMIPRVQQYRDLAIAVFDGVSPQPPLTHAWFPTLSFDEWRIEGNRALARSGDGLAFLCASGRIDLATTGPSAGADLMLDGHCAVWLLRIGSGATLEDFATTHSPLAAAPALESVSAQGALIEVEDAEYGLVRFHGDGRVEAEGRMITPDTWSLSGHREELPLGPLPGAGATQAGGT